jgi:hypothetical membrane protein
MKARYPLTTISGLLTIVIYLSLSLVAYARYPTAFRPSDNWLSDLGNKALSPQGAIYYRTGAVLTAVLLAVFFAALGTSFRKHGGKGAIFMTIAQICGSLAALALLMTGIYSEDRAAPHSAFSAALYILFGTAVFFVGWARLYAPGHRRRLSYFAFAVVVAVWVFAAFPHTHWVEWAVVFLLLGFVGSVAFAMRRPDRHPLAAQH